MPIGDLVPVFENPIAIRGAPGSPYTRKMLAVLRYRRIPYRFLVGLWTKDEVDSLPSPKVDLLPTFYFETDDGVEAVVDSTPIIRRLEAEVLGRSVIPHDPALAFIDYLLEDYADEWLTKAMFHYRWQYPADIELAGEILPRWRDLTASAGEIAPRSQFIRDRQIGRLYVVGSNEVTLPVIEASYRRLLGLLDAHIGNGPFLFGQRPGAADFGLYGQLTQLATFDPNAVSTDGRGGTRAFWPGCKRWTIYPGWIHPTTTGSPATRSPKRSAPCFRKLARPTCRCSSRTRKAVDAGAEQVRAEVEGEAWVQQPFPYQAKCLQWVRQEYGRLGCRRPRGGGRDSQPGPVAKRCSDPDLLLS